MNKKIKALLYCTKGKTYLRVYPFDLTNSFFQLTDDSFNALNGKIVAEVEIDKVEEIVNGFSLGDGERGYVTNDMSFGMLLEKSCLAEKELEKYLQEDIGYSLHLTNLKVFDKPKELSEYSTFDPEHYIFKDIKKAPQNMCRVVKQPKTMWAAPKEQYVLISIQPQHLCNILNGKKTIEVRKQVLNCLKEMLGID